MEPLQILIVFLLSPSSKGMIYIGVGSKQMVMSYYIIYSPLKTGYKTPKLNSAELMKLVVSFKSSVWFVLTLDGFLVVNEL